MCTWLRSTWRRFKTFWSLKKTEVHRYKYVRRLETSMLKVFKLKPLKVTMRFNDGLISVTRIVQLMQLPWMLQAVALILFSRLKSLRWRLSKARRVKSHRQLTWSILRALRRPARLKQAEIGLQKVMLLIYRFLLWEMWLPLLPVIVRANQKKLLSLTETHLLQGCFKRLWVETLLLSWSVRFVRVATTMKKR